MNRYLFICQYDLLIFSTKNIIGMNLSSNISEQIEQLKLNDHVTSVETISSNQLKIEYYPHDINCPYKDHSYVLWVNLSNQHPSSPPKIKFKQPIYHLNVSLQTGQIKMPILEQDWSPFLSLSSVIESLDRVLQDPEEDYAANQQLLSEYKFNKDVYLKNIVSWESKSGNNQFENTFNYQQQKQPNSFEEDKGYVENIGNMIESFKQNLHHLKRPDVSHENEEVSSAFFRGFQNSPRQSQTRSMFPNAQVDSHYRNSQSEKKGFKNFSLYDHNNTHSKQQNIQSLNTPELGKQRIKLTAKNIGQKPSIQLQINKSLGIFVNQINILQLQIKNTNNQSIKKLLEQAIDNQIQMIKELVQLSNSAKAKVIQQLKNQIKNI